MSPFQLLHTLFLFCLILLPTLSNAYSWQLNTTPSQCSNVSISIVGGDGRPPYRVLIIPFGPSPLPNSIEIRNFIGLSFDGNSTLIDFPLNYPARSQFVAVVSDATGFATGGTSNVMTVGSSSDTSCFNASNNTPPQSFSFSISPTNFSQCLPNLIWWNGQDTQRTPDTFLVVVPGGQSFTIPTTNARVVNSSGGKGFYWLSSLPTGTTFALLGNSSHGIGSATTTVYSMAYNYDRSCLNSTNPSLIDQHSPGAIDATNADKLNTATCDGIKSNSVNYSPIVGGILGGVITALLVTLVYTRRKRCTRKPRILEEDSSDLDQQYYRATLHSKLSSRDLEPNRFPLDSYAVPRSPPATEGTKLSSSRKPNERHESTHRTCDGGSSGSLAISRPSQRRATSSRTRLVIQHGDAGPSNSQSSHSHGERDVVELPPAYTNIRRSVNHLHRFRFCPNQARGGSIK